MPVSKFLPCVSKILIIIYHVTQLISSAWQIKQLNMLRYLNLVVAVVVVVVVVVVDGGGGVGVVVGKHSTQH